MGVGSFRGVKGALGVRLFFFLSLSVPYLPNGVCKETLGDNVLGRGSNIVV